MDKKPLGVPKTLPAWIGLMDFVKRYGQLSKILAFLLQTLIKYG